MTITDELVGHVRELDPGSIAPAAMEIARDAVADGVAVMLAGATDPSGLGHVLTEYARDNAGAAQASVVGGGLRTSATEAAFVNGTLAHALDFDNCWYPLNHPTSPTLPAILAWAEHTGASGRQCLDALVVAFEVQARLRMASTGLHTGRGYHKPGTTGLMGAVAAMVRLLCLDHDQALMAFGIAGSRLGSLSLNTGTMTKATHSGHAARMGLESALLAQRGWTASRDVFGPGGYFDTLLGDEQEPSRLVDDFAEPLWMLTPGVGFKKYPSNYFTHRVIDAALAVRARGAVDTSDLREVVIRFPDLHYVDRPTPDSGLDGKFSLQYAAAVALLDGHVTIDSFTDERRFRDDVEALLPLIRIVFDPEISAEFLDLHVVLTAKGQGGAEDFERVQRFSGMPGVPLTDTERSRKFFDCATRTISMDDAERLKDLLDRFDELEDVDEVMALARADHG